MSYVSSDAPRHQHHPRVCPPSPPTAHRQSAAAHENEPLTPTSLPLPLVSHPHPLAAYVLERIEGSEVCQGAVK